MLNLAKLEKSRLVISRHLATLAQVKRPLKSYAEIPGPKPLPVVGNLLDLKNFGALASTTSKITCDHKLSRKISKKNNLFFNFANFVNFLNYKLLKQYSYINI